MTTERLFGKQCSPKALVANTNMQCVQFNVRTKMDSKSRNCASVVQMCVINGSIWARNSLDSFGVQEVGAVRIPHSPPELLL